MRERTITLLDDNCKADIKARIGDAKIASSRPKRCKLCIDAPRKRGAPVLLPTSTGPCAG